MVRLAPVVVCTLILHLACVPLLFALSPAPAFCLHSFRGLSSTAISRWPKSTCHAPRAGFLGTLRLQQDPNRRDVGEPEPSLDIFRIFRESVKDASAAHKDSFSSDQRWSVNGALLLPLLSLPLWMGLTAFGLFLPSPDMILENLGGAKAAYSAPWDVVAVAKEVAPSLPFGTSQGGINLQDLANPQLDPSLFVPVCKFSDTFYRGAKNSVLALAGKEVYQEYAPLIAGSLLRVRLEFCVLESFVYESIVPFIKARGLSWVFPLRETLETFVAGVVFAVASNVVLIGSTKIISIAIFYSDFFIGLPIRLTFGFINDRLVKGGATKNPVGVVLVAGTGAIRLVGQTTEVLRKFIEFWDVFVGRYLLLTTFGYVVLKFLKFKGVLTIEKLGALWNALITASDSVPQ